MSYPSVYIITSKEDLLAGRIKLGYSVDPERRARQLQTGNVNDFTMLGFFLCPESIVKKDLQKHCINREWFSLNQEVVDYFKGLSGTFPDDLKKSLPQPALKIVEKAHKEFNTLTVNILQAAVDHINYIPLNVADISDSHVLDDSRLI